MTPKSHTNRNLLIVAILAAAAVAAGATALVARHLKPGAAEHVRRGNTYADGKKYAEAIIEYRSALQQSPKMGDVRLKLGDAYAAVNDLKGAYGEYIRAADLLPNSGEAQVKAGKFLLLARKFEDAKARADRAIAIDSKNVEAQILRGNALTGLKDFDAAIAEYQDAISLDPAAATAYDNIAMLQLTRGKKDEAEATFKKAVEAAPQSIPARLALANFYWSTGQRDLVEEQLKAALAVDNKQFSVNRALGMFYLAANRIPEAEPYFVALSHLDSDGPGAALTLADYYLVANRRDDARRLLQQQLSNEAVATQATIRLASLDAAEGHRAEGLHRLQDLLQKNPKNASALLASARMYMQDGKRTEARSAATAVTSIDPNSRMAASAWMIIGQIDASTDRSDDAIRAFEQVLKLEPQPLEADIALGRLYLRRLDTGKAITYAQQALTIRKLSPEAIDLLVRAELASGDVAKATADLEPIASAYPKAIGVLKLKALVDLASRRPDAARATYMQILAANQNDAEAIAAVSRIDLSGGHAKEALARVDDQLKRAKPSVALLTNAARTYAAVGNFDRVESLLKQAIELDPDRLQPYLLLGQVYTRQRRLDDAIEQFSDALAKNPKSVAAATMIAMLREVQGRTADAEKGYQQVLRIDAHAPVASNNLAWIYVASNRNLDEALTLAQTAQQALPEEPNVNDTLGWIYYRKNMVSQAIGFLETAAQKQPNEPVHHFHLGMAYMQMGDFAKARAALKHAFELKPDFEGAAEAKKALTTIGA